MLKISSILLSGLTSCRPNQTLSFVEGLRSIKRLTYCVYVPFAIVAVLSVAAWAISDAASPRLESIDSFRPDQRPVTSAPLSVMAETLTLTSQGFQPAEITPSTGRFLLGVDNQTLGEALSLELFQQDGLKAQRLRMAKGQIRLRKLVNLPPGHYTLQVVGHPQWQCAIVVPNLN